MKLSLRTYTLVVGAIGFLLGVGAALLVIWVLGAAMTGYPDLNPV